MDCKQDRGILGMPVRLGHLVLFQHASDGLPVLRKPSSIATTHSRLVLTLSSFISGERRDGEKSRGYERREKREGREERKTEENTRLRKDRVDLLYLGVR